MVEVILKSSLLFLAGITSVMASSGPTPNQSLDSYLEDNRATKLMLCCGHNAEMDTLTRDKDGKYEFHSHEGWYTVDVDSDLNPDVEGDLTDPQTLAYVFRPNTYKAVTEEYADDEIKTRALYEAIAQILMDKGVYVFRLQVFTNYDRMEPEVKIPKMSLGPDIAADCEGMCVGEFMTISTSVGEALSECQKMILSSFQNFGFANVQLFGAIPQKLKKATTYFDQILSTSTCWGIAFKSPLKEDNTPTVTSPEPG